MAMWNKNIRNSAQAARTKTKTRIAIWFRQFRFSPVLPVLAVPLFPSLLLVVVVGVLYFVHWIQDTLDATAMYIWTILVLSVTSEWVSERAQATAKDRVSKRVESNTNICMNAMCKLIGRPSVSLLSNVRTLHKHDRKKREAADGDPWLHIGF